MIAPAICPSEALRDGGPGVRFTYSVGAVERSAFVVRYTGRVYAYVNACAHRQVELDWAEGEFFDAEGAHLICATHGARYHPATGACVAGPCAGRGLQSVPVHERNGIVYAGDEPVKG